MVDPILQYIQFEKIAYYWIDVIQTFNGLNIFYVISLINILFKTILSLVFTL